MKNNLTESAPLLLPSVCLMVGIAVYNRVSTPFPLFPVLLFLLVVAICSERHALLQSVVIATCVFVLGGVLIQHQQQVTAEVRRGEPSDDHSTLGRSRTFFLQQRERLLDRLSDAGLEGDAYAVVAAMALGDKSALTKRLREVYSVSGASHVLALSGLHLSIIYTLLTFLVVGRHWQLTVQIAVIVTIWLFVFLVGMPVGVVRSGVMLTVYALLSLGHRNKMSLNTLAFTVMVMLTLNPSSLFDVGFQMSFMSVLSILLFYPLFESVFSQRYLMTHGFAKWLWGMLAVSCSAQLGVAPLIAYYFGRFSVYFLLTNLIVIPATMLLLYLTLIVLLLPSLAYLLIYIIEALNRTLTLLAALPGASIEEIHPTLLQVGMVYLIEAALYQLACLYCRIRKRGKAYM